MTPIIDDLKNYGHGVRVVIVENEGPAVLEKLIAIDAATEDGMHGFGRPVSGPA